MILSLYTYIHTCSEPFESKLQKVWHALSYLSTSVSISCEKGHCLTWSQYNYQSQETLQLILSYTINIPIFALSIKSSSHKQSIIYEGENGNVKMEKGIRHQTYHQEWDKWNQVPSDVLHEGHTISVGFMPKCTTLLSWETLRQTQIEGHSRSYLVYMLQKCQEHERSKRHHK